MSVLAIDLNSISGIPVHPLVVHIPVMLVPLAFIGAIAALARPSWRSWCLPLTAIFAGGALVGVQLAMQSGEALQEIVSEGDALIQKHADLAEQARPIVFLFFLAAAAAAIAFHLINREDADATESADSSRTATLRKALVPLLVLSVLTGALSTAWIYRTGHSGAESVWKEKVAHGGGGEGGEGGGGRGEGGEGGEGN